MNVERTRFYSAAVAVIRAVYRFIFRAKARGVENFPRDENCILYGNHISAWDPLTLAAFYRHSEIHFIAKESLYKIPLLPGILKRLHAFRVKRGETDMAAMRKAMQVLREGHVLGIFPEGHRLKAERVTTMETGVAVLALRCRVPVVPVFLAGRCRPFGKVRAVVGKPVFLEDLRARRQDTETLEAIKARLIDSLEALRPLADF